MLQPGRTYSTSSYRYGFNGKEKENEIKGEGNQLDYGLRVYDPRAGRFLSVDPLTKSFAELTPYQYASNIPIKAVDIDGLEASWRPPGQTIGLEQIGSRPDATNQSATNIRRAEQQQEIKVQNQQAQIRALSVPKSLVGSTDNSAGANMRREAFRQQAEAAKRVNQAMMTPEGQGGMGLAGIMKSTVEAPVSSANHSYGIYEGIQEKDGWKIAGNTFGLVTDVASVMPFFIKGPKLAGSGPVSGVLEVSSNAKSVEAFLNYKPVQGI